MNCCSLHHYRNQDQSNRCKRSYNRKHNSQNTKHPTRDPSIKTPEYTAPNTPATPSNSPPVSRTPTLSELLSSDYSPPGGSGSYTAEQATEIMEGLPTGDIPHKAKTSLQYRKRKSARASLSPKSLTSDLDVTGQESK